MNNKIASITTDNVVEMENVGMNPNESAIQPPMSGAMIVAGAVRVCARPM
jgi:hypothetical protein